MAKPTYQFCPTESGLFVEIYLPKRAEYQVALYDALTEGFQKDKVESHFRNATTDRKEGIRNLLEDNYPTIADYTDQMIFRLMEFFGSDIPLFSGYSMYEVDGVFYRKDKGIIQDRTQVIRIMFRPSFRQYSLDSECVGAEELDGEILRSLAAVYFNSLTPDRASFVKRLNELTHAQKLFINFLDEWTQSVALFLFGFLIYNICEKLLELRSEDKNKGEEEIWVTCFWNLKITRFPYLEEGGTKAGMRAARRAWEREHGK